jgi:multidrug resistance efflux pump
MTTLMTDTPTTDERVASGAPPPGGGHLGRGRRFLRALRTLVVTVVLFSAAALGGVYIVGHRLAAQAYVDLGTAMLTADAVPVGSPDAAVVTSLRVNAQRHVIAGQPLAVLTLTAGASQAGTGAATEATTQTLRAPMDGTVAAVNVALGGVVKAGEPVVTLYDQSKLSFQADVPVDRLKRLRLGMTAYIDGPGLAHRVQASLARIVPRVGGVSDSDRLTVVLLPRDSAKATVSTLVPGLPYTAIVDTKTSTGGTPAVNSAG